MLILFAFLINFKYDWVKIAEEAMKRSQEEEKKKKLLASKGTNEISEI